MENSIQPIWEFLSKLSEMNSRLHSLCRYSTKFSFREILSVCFIETVRVIFFFVLCPASSRKPRVGSDRFLQNSSSFYTSFLKHTPHFQMSRFLLIQNPDIQSDRWNLPGESYESAIWERRPSVRKGRPPG